MQGTPTADANMLTSKKPGWVRYCLAEDPRVYVSGYGVHVENVDGLGFPELWWTPAKQMRVRPVHGRGSAWYCRPATASGQHGPSLRVGPPNVRLCPRPRREGASLDAHKSLGPFRLRAVQCACRSLVERLRSSGRRVTNKNSWSNVTTKGSYPAGAGLRANVCFTMEEHTHGALSPGA